MFIKRVNKEKIVLLKRNEALGTIIETIFIKERKKMYILMYLHWHALLLSR
jgi:hypothetical protein